jgi:hypothetical protein
MTSSYTQGLNHDILECIENETVEYKKYGNILLCGDFNARVSSCYKPNKYIGLSKIQRRIFLILSTENQGLYFFEFLHVVLYET